MNLYSYIQNSIPDDFIVGLDRNDTSLVAHLYKGTFGNPGSPMCARGWNRENGKGYSIFRNYVGTAGVCKICLRRAKADKEPVHEANRNTKWV